MSRHQTRESEREGFRLLTLHGSGGMGKMRLAIEFARRVTPDFDDNILYVPLQGITDPAGIYPAIARSLEQPSPAPGEAPRDLAAGFPRGRCLVVLDNFEHLVEGGTQQVVDLLKLQDKVLKG